MPLEIYSPHLFLASFPSPGSNGSHPAASVPMLPIHQPPLPHQQWMYGGGDPEMDYYQQVHHLHRQQYYPTAAGHHIYDRAHRRRKTEKCTAWDDGRWVLIDY